MVEDVTVILPLFKMFSVPVPPFPTLRADTVHRGSAIAARQPPDKCFPARGNRAAARDEHAACAAQTADRDISRLARGCAIDDLQRARAAFAA
jgi:hypothetical protein